VYDINSSRTQLVEAMLSTMRGAIGERMGGKRFMERRREEEEEEHDSSAGGFVVNRSTRYSLGKLLEAV